MKHRALVQNTIAALIKFGRVQRLVRCPMLVDHNGRVDRNDPVFADCYADEGHFDKNKAKLRSHVDFSDSKWQ